MAGALAGLKIVEMAGIGPAPFAAMMLADHGAEVVRIARPGSDDGTPAAADILSRSRTTLYVDIKRKGGVDMVMDLLATTDGLIEGFRPGVMERLGLDPQMLLERNPRLVCGRMTGWGQEGPLAKTPGHDINYIALAGALDPIGRVPD